jgi:hypothetical protein
LVRLTAGALLVSAAFGDRRSLLFGLTMILSASPYARGGLTFLIENDGFFSTRAVTALPLEALYPCFFWRFARVFPEAYLRPSLDRIIDWAERASLAVGVFLIAGNLTLLFFPQLTVLQVFRASDKASLFPTLLYSLTFPILFVLWLRMRTAREEERRRVQVFIIGLSVTIVPAIIAIVMVGISADFLAFVQRDDIRTVMDPLVYALIVATPMITTYAVLVERILPVKILLRQTFRYWLGNGFIVLSIALPVLLLAYYLYVSRASSLAALFGGYNGLFIAVALGISLFMFEQRHRARQYLDELFYRSGYDANAVLAELAQNAQSCMSLADLAHAVQHALDSSLQPQSSHLLFVSSGKTLRDPQQELADLPMDSTLASALFAVKQPVHVRDIPIAADGDEKRWLAQADASILLPFKLKAVNSGMLVLGSKRSELPYTHADFNFLQLLLNTVTAPCGHLLETWNVLEGDRRAAQCSNCGTVTTEPNHCTTCGSDNFMEALLPKVLHQQYDVIQVLGGSLGIVYLAHDTQLQRPVVLKTVASASVEEWLFLRDEARVMATVNHPHIASIFGLESYQGMPILVCEYLPGGTLEELLRDGYLARNEALTIIEQVARALGFLHGRGIAHGDVKPSNIGFDAEETAKLLDFGLANRIPGPSSIAGPSGGTYAYMSPEKIQQQACDQRADLWALAVSLFEALYGINPFAADDLPGVIENVANAERTVFAAVASPSPFFVVALSNDIARRPQTAEQFITLMRAAL